MGKKKRRRGVSAGSVVMLVITLLVIAGCCAFLLSIAGEGVYERTGALIRALSGRGGETAAPAETAWPSEPQQAGESPAQALPTPTAERQEGADLPGTLSFTLAAAGTVCAPRAVRMAAQDAQGYDFSPMFEGLGSLLRDADLALATLETSAAGEEPGYGSYNAPPQLLDALRASGVGVLSLATERALDKGYAGLELTQRELTSRSLTGVGADASGQETGAAMLQVNGVRVAVLAYAYGLSDEGREQTGGDPRGALSVIDEERMTRDIVNARLAGANAVIVLPHWGTKNRRETPDDVRALAKRLAEAGADVILGAHPNVAQGTERLTVTRSDGLPYEAVVCYSLGCLLTDSRDASNTAGMIARLTVRYDPAARRVTLGDLACEPVYVACQTEDGRSVYRVVDANEPSALAALEEGERAAAERAAQTVRDVSGQRAREEAGVG